VPLDEFLPDYDVNEVHAARVPAAPGDALAAIRAVTAREVPLLVALMAIRRLPAAVLRRRGGPLGRALDEPLLDQFVRGGFVVLADRPDELVLGAVGRFWTMDGGVRRLAASDFRGFDEPDFAKAVVNFHVRATDGGSLVTTETRVLGTSETAKRRFRRYWRIVMPGSAAIRRAWLRAIGKRAERGGRGERTERP
jgi:hypothetical protein